MIAATNRDLAQMVQEGRFREDLYFRLQVFPVQLPALRQRSEDIPLLVRYFIDRAATHLHKEIHGCSSEAMAALQHYPWPGNVRELEHTIQRAIILCKGRQIELEHIQLTDTPPPEPAAATPLVSLKEQERHYILQVLEHTAWKIKGPGGAASILDLPESTLRNRMKRLGIRR